MNINLQFILSFFENLIIEFIVVYFIKRHYVNLLMQLHVVLSVIFNDMFQILILHCFSF